MSLTKEDLKAIQGLLIPIEVRILGVEQRILGMEGRFGEMEGRFGERFNQIDANFDALFKRDESRQQEYLVLTSQMSRIEARVTSLEDKLT